MRKFKAINTGGLAVGFTLDIKAMQKGGFILSPEDLPVLAGAPTHQAADLTITLQVNLSIGACIVQAYQLLSLSHPCRIEE